MSEKSNKLLVVSWLLTLKIGVPLATMTNLQACFAKLQSTPLKPKAAKDNPMTRKHFQAIADVIKNTPFTDPQDRVILAHRMAEDVCQAHNSLFNKARFLKACGIED
jgi:hypothetical protein